MSDAEDVSTGRLLTLEYERIKDEQRARIGFRDNLLYATLASMAGVIAVAVQAGPGLLLLLPPTSLLLGWTYLVNDEKISAIGRYVRGELAPALGVLVGAGETAVFGWETAHRSDPHRVSRKWLQLGVDLLTFCGAPLAAVVVYWSVAEVQVALGVLSAVELLAVAVLAWQIALYADLRRGGEVRGVGTLEGAAPRRRRRSDPLSAAGGGRGAAGGR
ncbi:hypothetical protein [Kitasatospora sp. NPDC093806]|uniref:hypothetical protein n=1 Tax=Kitasatospora sp. NPDC093806 TaxID=3155075 RepID=UPI003424CF0D